MLLSPSVYQSRRVLRMAGIWFKTISGVKYTFAGYTSNKKVADKTARELRRDGFSVRILPIDDPKGLEIWRSVKRASTGTPKRRRTK